MVPLAGSGVLDPIKYHRLFVIILSYHLISICYRSGGASLVKDTPAIQETRLNSWVGKFPWRKDRLPKSSILGLPWWLNWYLPAMWETWVWSLGCEDPLEEGMATHSSILVWRIPIDRGAWRAIVRGVAKSWTWMSDLSTRHIGQTLCFSFT